MTQSVWQLSGRNALVTGGTRGIGRAIAAELIALGAQVTIVARQQADLDTAIAELGHGTIGITGDVTSAADRARIVEQVSARGPLHVLVNNAGGNVRKKAIEYADETIEQLIGLNLTSSVHLSRALHPSLRAAEGASVIHIGSVGGYLALPTGIAYGVAKAGLAQAARVMALEWARDGIRVNTVAPWYTRTPLAAPILARPEVLAAIVAQTPLGRIAEPREVATAVAFLALPAASYITGQCLSVDGGMSIQGLSATALQG